MVEKTEGLANMPIIFIILLMVAGCAHQPFFSAYTTSGEYLEYQKLLTKGEEMAALKQLRSLQHKYPKERPLMLLLADLERRTGHCDEAMVLYSATTGIEAQEGIGLCLLHKGRFAEAGEVLAKVLAEDATQWRSINAFGVALALTNQLGEALHYFTLADEIAPNTPQILNNFALTQAMGQNYSGAIAKLERARTLLPEDSPYRKRIALNLALVYGSSGKLALAEETAKPFLSETDLHHNLAIYALMHKNKSLAKEHLHKALATQNYNQASWQLMLQLEDEEASKA